MNQDGGYKTRERGRAVTFEAARPLCLHLYRKLFMGLL